MYAHAEIIALWVPPLLPKHISLASFPCLDKQILSKNFAVVSHPLQAIVLLYCSQRVCNTCWSRFGMSILQKRGRNGTALHCGLLGLRKDIEDATEEWSQYQHHKRWHKVRLRMGRGGEVWQLGPLNCRSGGKSGTGKFGLRVRAIIVQAQHSICI